VRKNKLRMICLYQQEGLDFFEIIESALRESLNLSNIVFLKHIKIPSSAFNSLRFQYEGEKIIDKIYTEIPKQCDIGVVIVDADIYAPRMNFIFGLAEPLKKIALVSTYRLKEEDGKLKERLAKEVVHEVCHLLGLGHCDNPNCVMFFSDTIYDTDRKGRDLCEKCRRNLERI